MCRPAYSPATCVAMSPTIRRTLPGDLVEILVTYDIATTTIDGEVRLRKVAKVCEAYGQRVQKSVFECTLNDVQFELLKRDLLAAIRLNVDSIRIYRLREPFDRFVWMAGRQREWDIRKPLIL